MRLPTRLLAFTVLLSGASLFAEDAATTTAPAPLTAPPISGKLGTPIQVFNGKDLGDWTWHPLPSKKVPNPTSKLEEVWSVSADGILHSKGKPTGYLQFETPFTNYVITVEERHLEKGNGGIMVGMMPEKVVKGGGRGWEIQTMTDNAGGFVESSVVEDDGEMRSGRRNKGQRIVKERAGLAGSFPVGEWDTMEVVVDKGTLTFSVNGMVQNVVTDTESLAGKVGLQAEGPAMEFRKVQVTPIE